MINHLWRHLAATGQLKKVTFSQSKLVCFRVTESLSIDMRCNSEMRQSGLRKCCFQYASAEIRLPEPVTWGREQWG
jgi:hypothetical protein